MNMRFMSSKTLANSNTPQLSQNKMAIQPSPFRMRFPASSLSNPAVPQIAVPTKSPEKKVKWGPAVWFALHTMAEKIKEDSFSKIREPLLKWIYTICTHLPCPDCSMHAKTYLDGINFNTIQSKTDLKRMIFDFHNAVNYRKGYPQFAYEDLDTKYSTAVTKNILQNFVSFFEDRNHRSVKLIATDLHRALISNEFKKWINENIQYFNA
jgi:hypothetical protein